MANPFLNQKGYDSFEQSQNPASYGGGRAADDAGARYDDPLADYE